MAAMPGAGMLQVGHVVGPDDVLEDDWVVDVVEVVVVVITTGGDEVEDVVTVVLNTVDDADVDVVVVVVGQFWPGFKTRPTVSIPT